MPICSVCHAWNDLAGPLCPRCGSEADPFGTAQPPVLEPSVRVLESADRRGVASSRLESISKAAWDPFQTIGQPPRWLFGEQTDIGPLPPLVSSSKARGPREQYAIQFWKQGRWHLLVPRVRARGTTLRRRNNPEDDLGPGVRRVRFDIQEGRLRVLDLGAGVFRKIQGPVDLVDGSRLRIGRRTLVFRQDAGPELESRLDPGSLGASALLEVARLDGTITARFPIVGPSIIVGRKPGAADLVLDDDPLISARHLQITAEDGRYRAQDLNSRNGTFLALSGSDWIEPGEILDVAGQRLRVIEMS